MEPAKPYTGPEIFRVELDHQPAILSACSLRALHPMQMGMVRNWCRTTHCKNANNMGMGMTSADSAARPS